MSLPQGKKFDDHKLRFDLIPPECEESLARVLTHGANKYEANNWQKVEPFKDRYYAALRRHINAWRHGEIIDPETGLFHSAQIMCNAMFLLWRDIHEHNDIRPNADRAFVDDSISTKDSVSSMPNDYETAFRRAKHVEDFTRLLDHLRTHKCIGAYSIVSNGDGSVTVVFSPDNSPPAYVANLE